MTTATQSRRSCSTSQNVSRLVVFKQLAMYQRSSTLSQDTKYISLRQSEKDNNDTHSLSDSFDDEDIKAGHFFPLFF